MKGEKNNTGSEIGNSDSDRPRWITKDAEMYHFTLCTSADTHILRTYNWSTTGTTIYNCVVRKMSPHKSFYCWQTCSTFIFWSLFCIVTIQRKNFSCAIHKKANERTMAQKKYSGAIWPNLLGSMKAGRKIKFRKWMMNERHTQHKRLSKIFERYRKSCLYSRKWI